MNNRGTVFANFALFQTGWFACVLTAAEGYPWVGSAAAVAIVARHLRSASRPLAELKLIVQVVLIGAVWDSLLVLAGWVGYPSGTVLAGTAPHWILALWALFATSLNVSLRWLKGRLVLAAVLGAIGAPLSYWAAMRLGAVYFIRPEPGLVALALGWSLIVPVLMLLARRFDGFAPEAPQLA